MSDKKRTICVVTGSRSEYGLLKPVLEAIERSPRFVLQTIVAGMHLDSEFGRTADLIQRDGFPIHAKVQMQSRDDQKHSMAKAIGQGVIGFTKALKKLKPDVVIVLGDRTEGLAAAVATTYSGIALAHIHGGDSAQAGLDEYARHAITKLAHIHFPATQKSAQRIKKLGEEPWRIFLVGAPGLDHILHEKGTSVSVLAQRYQINGGKPLLLVVQHPVTTDVESAQKQMMETMEAVSNSGHQTIVIYPNSDAGGRSMIQVLKEYQKKNSRIKAYASIPRSDYIGLMRAASVLIGNSSSGIIESSSLHLPVINIGTRQKGREHSTNILHVDHDRKVIAQAIRRALDDTQFLNRVKRSRNPYGEGKAGKRIASILSDIDLSPRLLQKKLTY